MTQIMLFPIVINRSSIFILYVFSVQMILKYQY